MPSAAREPAYRAAAFRAWQRMLSGRRLDLLDPSPLDVEIEDIAHGLARVARWNGQTEGAHIFSVAQHSLLVETIARQRARLDRASRLARSPARRARIRDRRHDLAVQGGDRRRLQGGGGAAARGHPSALRACRRAAGRARRADQGRRPRRRLSRGDAACRIFHRARRGDSSARRPSSPPSIERDYLTPWPAEVAERRYLERFAKLVAGLTAWTFANDTLMSSLVPIKGATKLRRRHDDSRLLARAPARDGRSRPARCHVVTLIKDTDRVRAADQHRGRQSPDPRHG